MTPGAILDAALALAGERGWGALRLHQVARALDIPLAEVHRHFREKDDLAEALFDRADRTMLEAADALRGPLPGRLHALMATWFQALEPHKPLVRDMVAYKLEPPHLHLQAAAVLRISRTVQWFLEASGSPSSGLRRSAEEVALTGLFVSGFILWLQGDTRRAMAWLERRLHDPVGRMVFGATASGGAPGNSAAPG